MNKNSSFTYHLKEDHQQGETRCGLYLITPPYIELRKFNEQLKQAIDGGTIECFQLRLKNSSDDAILGATETLMPLLQQYEIPFLINDRPDLALKTNANGVHIGQTDASYEEARSLLGDDAIVGVTCHNSRHLAMLAGEKGANYVAFGSFFNSKTKKRKFTADINLIRWWRDVTVVQSVAIGGITPNNCKAIISAGADFLAVSGGVWDHPDGPKAAVSSFHAVIASSPLEDPII